MTDINALKDEIRESGLSMTMISKKSGIERTTLYNRLNGVGEFTSSEIVGLTDALKLSNAKCRQIFLIKG